MLIGLIKGYGYFISPLLAPSCRFYPSCSEYALTALQQHSIFMSCYLIIRRILRCHPFHSGGYDPVPHVHNKIG